MLFIETPIFTADLLPLLGPEEYRRLQTALLLRPEHGRLIEGGGGLRKTRWGFADRGKRGGLRIIYYWDKPNDTIYMIMVYPKTFVDDLTPRQVKTLRDVVKKELRHGQHAIQKAHPKRQAGR